MNRQSINTLDVFQSLIYLEEYTYQGPSLGGAYDPFLRGYLTGWFPHQGFLYTMPFQYTRCGAVFPGTFLPVLMIGVPTFLPSKIPAKRDAFMEMEVRIHVIQANRLITRWSLPSKEASSGRGSHSLSSKDSGFLQRMYLLPLLSLL